MTVEEAVLEAVEEPTCAECGNSAERSYVPVRDGEPAVEDAVCQTCAWNDVGYAGCAPEAGDLDADVLVRVDDAGSDATVTDGRD